LRGQWLLADAGLVPFVTGKSTIEKGTRKMSKSILTTGKYKITKMKRNKPIKFKRRQDRKAKQQRQNMG
jgi:hypothetical protein